MKNAIVSGANGLIGGAVTKELLNNGYHVQGLVHRDNSRIEKHPNLEIISFSLDNILSIKDVLEPSEFFYHFAWDGITEPKRSDTKMQLNNAQWTVDALKLAKEIGCSRFVCAGSIMERESIYSMHENGCMPGMGYIYGGGKVAAHIMSKSVAAELGIDLIWGIVTNTYGPGEISQRLICSTLIKIINGKTPKFTAGTQNYDFVYIDDVARAFRLIGERGLPFSEYLIGSSKAKALREFLTEINETVAKNMNFIYGDIPFTGTNLPISVFDCKNTERDTGFRASVPFKEGIARTL